MTPRTLTLRTPEDVEVSFDLATPAQRVTAFVIDAGLALAAVLGAQALLWLVGMLPWVSSLVTHALGVALTFLARNLYFAWAELRFQGRPPGKRFAGLRVIARDGGPLTGAQVVARNLTRELELFLPLTALFLPETLMEVAPPPWVRVAAATWALGLLLFPLLNRSRARVGDLLAGTVVVRSPRPRLLPDLAQSARHTFRFTNQELDLYGIKELQVLEGLLRRTYADPELIREVAARICKKIGRGDEAPEQARVFLEDFYAAQRARLEQKMLMGERREEKVR